MGSGEEWANERDRKGCPLWGAALFSGIGLTVYGVYVLVADVAKLFS